MTENLLTDFDRAIKTLSYMVKLICTTEPDKTGFAKTMTRKIETTVAAACDSIGINYSEYKHNIII